MNLEASAPPFKDQVTDSFEEYVPTILVFSFTLNIKDVTPIITGPSGGAGASTSSISINENSTAVHTVSADRNVRWRIFGGSDYKLFDIDENTGTLSFKSAPDYENPGVPNRYGGNSNTYTVNIGCFVGQTGEHSSQLVKIHINDIDEVAPKITGPSGGAGAGSSSKSINENSAAVHTFSASETVTWSLNGGADASKFSINSSSGALTFKSAPDY